MWFSPLKHGGTVERWSGGALEQQSGKFKRRAFSFEFFPLRSPYLCSAVPPLHRLEASEKRHHPQVIGIRRQILFPDLEIQLRRLENERNPACATVGDEMAKRVHANAPFAQERMAITVRTELAFAVVQVEKRRRFAGRRLELVENTRHRIGRRTQIVA